jgi:hypothetical protein
MIDDHDACTISSPAGKLGISISVCFDDESITPRV